MSTCYSFLFWTGVFKHNKTFDICFSICTQGDYKNLEKSLHVNIHRGHTHRTGWCRLDSKKMTYRKLICLAAGN